MLSSNNVNISSRTALPSPGAIRSELPLSLEAIQKVLDARKQITDILDGKDHRQIVIVGPCSIHEPAAAMEYAQRLAELSRKVQDQILIVMRAYFEKPRTTVGWKGLIYDPDINGSYNIERGIFLARKLLLRIIDLDLPVATEVLDPIIAQYIADSVAWAAIGARTTESQTHRQLASGLSMPVGFKNATDGSFQVALDAIATARSVHSFIGVLEDGHVGVFRTSGNAYGHLVLRGGPQPNYGSEHIAFLKVAMRKAGLRPNIIVDCSHADSGKKAEKQHLVFEDVLAQLEAGEDAINGVMLESYLKAGNQKCSPGTTPAADISITDQCIGWEETESLILDAYQRLTRLHSGK
ncbi:MAG: 3-deoxy-7-phosphoheptulonate synthase [Lentisphaeria bacterium]|nr:3-deoxy-7-phosphoheptulonate synthase [Lentisphaeria bacterium]